ncbi:fluoride efflux transporter FluC [Nocardioides xinjiangensis]|uniref:fluoride efflux transporter FluC n=1 Tax=Nocardioides xinjiangensis TaxID=2817376 RepID=UPI001B30FA78|nr:CrcB family protein [Nocardioides sp. SYSU D00778]
MTTAPLRATDLALVAVGGAAGALLRHLVDSVAPATLLPWHTTAVNVVGALALGALPALAAVRRSHRVATLLGPGVLGGFTTVSTWAGQVRELAASGHEVAAGAHVALTLAAGLAAAALGRWLARRREPDEALR